MGKEKISSCEYRTKTGDLGVSVNFFWTRKRKKNIEQSVAYRIGHNPKRWSSSYGPFQSLQQAEFDFHSRFLKKIPVIYEKDYAFFYNSSETTPDGVVTLIIVDIKDNYNQCEGFYAILKVNDKVLWVSRNLHSEIPGAYLEGYTSMTYIYPKIEPYE